MVGRQPEEAVVSAAKTQSGAGAQSRLQMQQSYIAGHEVGGQGQREARRVRVRGRYGGSGSEGGKEGQGQS